MECVSVPFLWGCVAHPVLSVTRWFHGKISGPEAVGKLQPAEDGLFLVRESIRHPGDYVLCVSVSGEVIHYRVIYQDNKLTIDNTQFFYNLIDMIEVTPLCYSAGLWREGKKKNAYCSKTPCALLTCRGFLIAELRVGNFTYFQR